MPKTRCALVGCPNFAANKSSLCAVHKRMVPSPPLSDEPESFAERVSREEREQKQAAAAEFRERLASGDYATLAGGRLAELVKQAAEASGVSDELGALRITMQRVLVEETDLAVQAKLVARLAGVILQAAKTERLLKGQVAESLTDAIGTILLELEQERDG